MLQSNGLVRYHHQCTFQRQHLHPYRTLSTHQREYLICIVHYIAIYFTVIWTKKMHACPCSAYSGPEFLGDRRFLRGKEVVKRAWIIWRLMYIRAPQRPITIVMSRDKDMVGILPLPTNKYVFQQNLF